VSAIPLNLGYPEFVKRKRVSLDKFSDYDVAAIKDDHLIGYGFLISE
jgi:hypothetical protein